MDPWAVQVRCLQTAQRRAERRAFAIQLDTRINTAEIGSARVDLLCQFLAHLSESLDNGRGLLLGPVWMSADEFLEIRRKVDRLAWTMDDFIRVPGTNIRFGWDSILGLLPGVGDVLTLASQAYLIVQAFRVGVRKRVYVKMLGNAFIDFLIGLIPGVGDVFDIFWKSNRRNAALLEAEIARRMGSASRTSALGQTPQASALHSARRP